MADVVREIERKYEFFSGMELPDLRVRGVGTVSEPRSVQLDATYYDTAGGRLAAHGITLRCRTGGGEDGWHLKLPVEPGVRDEIHAPLAATPPDTPPAELTALVRSRVRDQPLVPVMRLVSERQVRLLHDDSGGRLAEVAVDRVQAEKLPQGSAAAWTEIEVELGAAGDTGLLDRVEKRLTEAGSRRAPDTSKLRRALTETNSEPAGAGHPGAVRAVTAGDHALRYVRAQVDAVVALDPAVRREAPDSVHQMRVATRRLRSSFRTFRDVLDPAITAPVADELKWAAAELGADRDREVLAARLSEAVDQLPGTLRMGPVETRLQEHSRTGHTRAHRNIVQMLDGGRYLALLDRLERLLAEPPLLPAAAATPPGKTLAKAVRRDTDRLARRVRTALSRPAGPERDLALHNARKAAKRARYAGEAALPALGKPVKKYVKYVKGLQKVLGEHQDSVVARSALTELAGQAQADHEISFTYGVLHERERELADRCERELPHRWADFTSAQRSGTFGKVARGG